MRTILGESQLLTHHEAAKLVDGDLNDTFPLLMYYASHGAYIYIEPIEGIYVLEIENQSYTSKVLSEMEAILAEWIGILDNPHVLGETAIGVDLERDSNAILAAAAPELLEALIKITNACEDSDQWPTFTEIAREAINKATS
jgi:hypothetical protein